MKRQKVLIGIIVVVAIFIVIYFINMMIQNSQIERISNSEKGTPEYAIAEQNYLSDIDAVSNHYVLEGDYLFSVTVTGIGTGVSRVGVQDSNGNYSFTNMEKQTIIPISQDIIYVINVYKHNEDLVFKFDLGVGLVEEQHYDTLGIQAVDSDDVMLYDNNGKVLTKISPNGTNFVSFFDIRQSIEDDYAIYAKYDGNEILVIDAENLRSQLQ